MKDEQMVEKVVFLDDDVIDNIIEKNDFKKNILVICKNSKIKEKLIGEKINCKIINDYKLSESQITKPLEWIKSWPNKIILEKKNFKELFLYEQIPLFWFLESRLYHKRIHGLIILIEQIKKILLVEKPNSILVIGDDEIYHIVSYLHNNVSHNNKEKKISKSNISQKNYSGFLIWKLFLLKIIRGVLTSSTKLNKKQSIVFLTEVGSWRKIYNSLSKKYEYQDIFFHNIIKKLKEKNQIIKVIDFENNPKRILNSVSLNKKRAASFKTDVIPWEKFLTLKIILKSNSIHNEFKNIWNKLKKSKKFQESLYFEEIPLYELLVNDFNELFNSFKAMAAIAMIITAEKIIETEKPSKIIMHDEYGALQLSFLYASKKFEIPSLSLQHGTISQNVFAYTHNDIDINNEKNNLNFPLPSKMCVWSENAKEALLNSGKFPITIPIITGDPKMDFFSDNQKNYKYEEILEKYNITPKKKIILFATENLPNLDEVNLIADTVLKSTLELNNLFLIIKIHPNEINFERYQKIATKYNISNFIILKDADLYELIYLSDLVIISYSTVGIESMRMLKPVISLNLLGMHNEAKIIKNKLAIEVRSENELTSAILECLENKNNERILKAKKFAEKEIGKTDNNSTEIIVNEILKLKYTEKMNVKEEN